MGFGKNDTGAIVRENGTMTVGTLANHAAAVLAGPGITEDFRILKSEICFHMGGLTDQEGGGGLQFGIANGELSVTEIQDCLNVIGPLDRNDRSIVERAERHVKVLSYGRRDVDSTSGEVIHFDGEGGSPIITSKFRWTYSDPEGWQWFVFNNIGATVTTGAVGQLQATHYGVWVT